MWVVENIVHGEDFQQPLVLCCQIVVWVLVFFVLVCSACGICVFGVELSIPPTPASSTVVLWSALSASSYPSGTAGWFAMSFETTKGYRERTKVSGTMTWRFLAASAVIKDAVRTPSPTKRYGWSLAHVEVLVINSIVKSPHNCLRVRGLSSNPAFDFARFVGTPLASVIFLRVGSIRTRVTRSQSLRN
jgi:hypothetical protein